MDLEASISALMAFLVYSNIIDGEFVFDDFRAIVRNGDVIMEKSVWRIFSDDFWGAPLRHAGSHRSYRPITTLSFRLNFALSGLDASKFHLTNNLLHSIATYLTCIAAKKIFVFGRSRKLATGILFALHPVHTEAVAGIVGRADILSTLFFLSALICYENQISSDERCERSEKSGAQEENISQKETQHSTFKKRSKCGKKQRQADKGKRRSIMKAREKITEPKQDFYDNCNDARKQPITLVDTSDTSSVSSNSSEECNDLKTIQQRDFVDECFSCSNSIQNCSHQLYPKFTLGLWILASYIFATLSIFSKEQGSCTLLLCVIYDLFFRSNITSHNIFALIRGERNKTRCQQRIVITIFFAFLIIFLRLLLPLLETLSGNFSNIFPQFSVYDNPAANHAVAKCRWLTLHYLAARHFLLLFFPHPLCYDWSMGSIPLIHDFSDIRNILTLIFHILLLFFCFIVFRFLTRRDTDERFIEKYLCLEADPSSQMTRNGDSVMRSLNRMTDVNRNDFLIQRTDCVVIFSVSIIILSFLPASNLFFYVGFVLAERVLYMSSVGSCILASQLIFALKQYMKKKCQLQAVFSVMLVFIFTLMAMKTIKRNEDWKDEFSLYNSATSINPAKSWASLGGVLKKRGQWLEAEAAYIKALNHEPTMADTYYNLGLLYYDQKRYKEAEINYRKAMLYRPLMVLAHLNLGVVLTVRGHKQEAEKYYRNATKLSDSTSRDPLTHAHGRISAYYNLANLLFAKNDYFQAIINYKKALNLIENWPTYRSTYKIYNMLGQCYHHVKKLKKAEAMFQKSFLKNSTHVSTYVMYARLLCDMKQYEKSDEIFSQAKSLNNEKPDVLLYHCEELLSRGEDTRALQVMEEAASTKIGANSYEINLRAANLFRAAKLYAKAETYYRNCIRIEPQVNMAFFRYFTFATFLTQSKANQ